MVDDAGTPLPADDDPMLAPGAPYDPRTAFAVLVGPRGARIAGQVVFGPAADVEALVTSGAAVAATAWQIAVSAPFHFPIPDEA